MSGFGDPGQMVFACEHVFPGRKPVRLAVHDEDGKWTFMCGSEADDGENLQYVKLKQVLERDPSVESISALEEGMVASRGSIDEAWEQSSLWDDE